MSAQLSLAWGPRRIEVRGVRGSVVTYWPAEGDVPEMALVQFDGPRVDVDGSIEGTEIIVHLEYATRVA